MSKPTLAFIGGGNMATSLIGGLIQKGQPAEQIVVSDPLPESQQQLADQFGVRTTADNASAVSGADVIILAVKPQIMAAVAKPLATALAHKPLVISIAAGIPISALENWLGAETPIVRCMPNTPALLQAGAAGLYATDRVSETQKALASDILSAVGLATWVESEADIDAVTAVSGSGPAYFFLVMEAMQKVGEELGLSPEAASKLTLQTALGAAKMALESDVDVSELRRRVTSPAGTTERAIQSFQASGLEEMFRRAMADCVQRAQEMAAEMS